MSMDRPVYLVRVHRRIRGKRRVLFTARIYGTAPDHLINKDAVVRAGYFNNCRLWSGADEIEIAYALHDDKHTTFEEYTYYGRDKDKAYADNR